ncbi:MAG: hypothetical protein WCG47_21060 [Dermatophilaceae bacterium]
MEELLLVAGESRVFTAAQARMAGYGQTALARLVRSQAVTALQHGWYAVGRPATEHESHLLRTTAAATRYAGRAVPSHYSELLRLGLPVFRPDVSTVHLTLIGPGQARRRAGLSVHPRSGLALTADGRLPPALAVVQSGMVCGPMDALIAADAALRRRLVTTADLTEAVAAVRGAPGTAQIGPFLDLADGRAQSAGETRLRHACHLMKLRVTPQVKISDGGRTAYVDLLLDDYPVVLEFDGMVKYGASGLRPGRDELIAEKIREDWLRGLGYEVVRVTWADLDDLPALGRRIGAAIRRAKVRRQ